MVSPVDTASSTIAALGSLVEVLEHRAEREAHARFLRFEDRSYSVGDARAAARRAAGALRELGVRRGDRVLALLGNCPEFIELWFGCAYLGALLVPLNTELVGEPLRYVVEHADPKLLVSNPAGLEALAAAAPQRLRDLPVVLCGEPVADEAATSFAQWMAGATSAEPVSLERSSPMSIIYTSGTTGMPKGVVLPHFSYVHTGANWMRHFGVSSDDVWMTSLPLFHVNAQQTAVMGALCSGCEAVIRPRFSASRYFEDARRFGATCASYIGSMLYILLRRAPGAGDRDHSLRLLAGGPAPVDILEDFQRRFGVRVYEAYGLTETATWCLANPIDAPRPGSCGRPLDYTEVQIHGEDGVPIAVGEVGEIVARTRVPDSFMLGYHQDEQATTEAWRGGWFRTGDSGSCDADGFFYFHGRTKDSIRRRGENISALQLEQALLAHPAVVECAALGVPAELGEEEIKVCVVADGDQRVDAHELWRFCERTLPRFMVPRYIEFYDALPKTPTQRVQKWKLVEAGVEHAADREDGHART